MDSYEVKVKINEDVAVSLNIPSELSADEFDALVRVVTQFKYIDLSMHGEVKKVEKPVVRKKKNKKGKQHFHLSPAQRVKFKQMYASGASPQEIKGELHLQSGTLSNLLWRVRKTKFPNWWNRIQ